MKKVIVIGLDGFEPRIAEPLMAAGELPNLAHLRELGGYTRLRTTYPAQTPVAWSTFSTGTNPGGHGIFDFLSRDPQTYLPVLGLTRYEQKNAFVPPKVVNQRRGEPLWSFLTQAGIHSTVLRCPCTYPPDRIQGRMLAGVGVPDLRGGLGTSTFYTSDPTVQVGHSEKLITLEQKTGPVNTHLLGPRSPKTRSDVTLPVTLEPDLDGRRLVLRSEGQPNVLEIREGRWSSWLRVKFKTGTFQSTRGMVRFYLKSLEPHLELYASPVNFDPEAPLFPISHPEEYAAELQARMGNFYTQGMAEDHDGLNNERFDEIAFLNQCWTVMREREKMMLAELERTTEGFFFCLFDTPDRLQHMMGRFRDPEHPARPAGIPDGLKNAVEEHYRACDAIVGKALEYADPETLAIVLSDHGMNSFRRGLNLNTWLHQNGFLALKSGEKPGPDQGDFFHNVDWTRTQAYALGLGTIYLNLSGREAQGIVPAEDAESLQRDIARGLTGLVDEECGRVAVRSVSRREEIYCGPYVHEAPDLLVNFESGYRVSWGTPLGGVPAGLFEDNLKKWSSDHVIDPELVPGVLWMNRPFDADGASLVDLAPSILAAFELPKGREMEGRNLLR